MHVRSVTTLGAAAAVACSSFDPSDVPAAFDLNCSIPQDQIFAGGPGRDGIPALTNPDIAPPDAISLSDESRVLGMVINGEARAYPLVILWWHEIVNDELGGRPVVVTYCPLTGSGIAFDPVAAGTRRNFGVSGLLYENNLVMFDRETESLWNQMLLGGQCGSARGVSLERLPVVETSWGAWKAMYPETTALTLNTGYFRSYGVYPYGDYAEPDNPRRDFPGSRFGDERPPKELVLGVHDGEDAVAFPFGELAKAGDPYGAVNEAINDDPVLVTYQAEGEVAMAFSRRVGDEVLTFAVADAAARTLVDAETGSTWDVRGLAVDGPLSGTALERYDDAYVAFWFAWSVYYPAIRLVELDAAP